MHFPGCSLVYPPLIIGRGGQLCGGRQLVLQRRQRLQPLLRQYLRDKVWILKPMCAGLPGRRPAGMQTCVENFTGNK
jgi:hypothetical protein